jgi:hypothetical protein
MKLTFLLLFFSFFYIIWLNFFNPNPYDIKLDGPQSLLARQPVEPLSRHIKPGTEYIIQVSPHLHTSKHDGVFFPSQG